jgi:hypothetical protein
VNKKFIVIIAAFTITVPGFMLFSYWYLGIFSSMSASAVVKYSASAYVGLHNGDYNKTGEQVVKTSRILRSYAFNCKPILIYFENAISVGKPYLKSAGGCIVESAIPPHVVQALKKNGVEVQKFVIPVGQRLATYGQTAVGLRKVWTELARLTDRGVQLKFPLLQIIHENGENEFLIATE